MVSGPDGQPKVIETLTELQSWLKGVERLPAPLPADWIVPAQTVFENQVKEIYQQQAEVIRLRQVGVYLAEKARAQRVLMQAALVELALGQKPDLFSVGSYPAAFTPQAIRGLARHPYPWGTLVHLAFEEGMMPSPDDPYYLSIQTAPVESLKGRFNQLQGEATKLVKTLAGAQTALAASPS